MAVPETMSAAGILDDVVAFVCCPLDRTFQPSLVAKLE